MIRNMIGLRYELYHGDKKIQLNRMTFGPDEAHAVNIKNAYTLLSDMFNGMGQPSTMITYGQLIDFMHNKYPWVYAASSDHHELLIIWKEFDRAD